MRLLPELDLRAILETLSRTPPFSSATHSDLESLAATAQTRRYAAGITLFLESDRHAATWIVASGRVRILTFLDESRTFQIEKLGPRQLFGVCCRIGGTDDRYQCTAVAETAVDAIRVPDASFFSLYARSPSVARASCELCARRLRVMRLSLRNSRRDVRSRLARVLMGLREGGGDQILATRHAMAAWVGAAPETVFRALADWRRRGVLTTGRGTVSVRNWEALEMEARGEEP